MINNVATFAPSKDYIIFLRYVIDNYTKLYVVKITLMRIIFFFLNRTYLCRYVLADIIAVVACKINANIKEVMS